MSILTTWCGSRVTSDRWPKVLKGWQRHAKRLSREVKRLRQPPRLRKLPPATLEHLLCESLLRYVRPGEGAVETLDRLLFERKQALHILAMDRLKTCPEDV